MSCFAKGSRVVSTTAGDYNQDGTVDAADYTVWRDTSGQTGSGLAADGNGDGSVNAGDYSVWVTNFGNTTAISTAVPEPGAWVLVLIAGMMMPSNRRRAGVQSSTIA